MLALAILMQEGWKTPCAENQWLGSRSWRNNNPGNLRASKFASACDGGFAKFETSAEGFLALQWDLIQKCKGNTTSELTGESTLYDLICTWAPKGDGNDPDTYANAVAVMIGLSTSTKLKALLEV
jgi:hypothetical protein